MSSPFCTVPEAIEELRQGRMIVLVDIPTLLAGGVGMYNDNREILKLLFESLNAELPLGRHIASVLRKYWLMGPFSLFFEDGSARLERVAFVASKQDMVLPCDVKDGRLTRLLRQMTERLAFDMEGIDHDWFTCSAVLSARPATEEGHLRGALVRDNPEGKEMLFPVTPLPEQWPADWKVGDYRYQIVLPRVPANQSMAPDQKGLDGLFQYIMGS